LIFILLQANNLHKASKKPKWGFRFSTSKKYPSKHLSGCSAAFSSIDTAIHGQTDLEKTT